MNSRCVATGALLVAAILTAWPAGASGQFEEFRARDRGGSGVPASQFATFIEAGDLVVYPFYEYYRDRNSEYKPSELGYVGDVDYYAPSRAHEGLLFVGYGLSSRWVLELEAAVITARQDKAGNDTSNFPATGLEESGLGDVEAQLRYRWREESSGGPEVFSYFETVFPVQEDEVLIGTTVWELKYGMGLARSTSWGTLMVRGGVAFVEGTAELGEYAVELVRGVSDRARLYAGIEGSEDEVTLITEAQIFLTPDIKLKLNSAFGVTQKAPGWAPEVGVMFRF
jgi:hypothetical protein